MKKGEGLYQAQHGRRSTAMTVLNALKQAFAMRAEQEERVPGVVGRRKHPKRVKFRMKSKHGLSTGSIRTRRKKRKKIAYASLRYNRRVA